MKRKAADEGPPEWVKRQVLDCDPEAEDHDSVAAESIDSQSADSTSQILDDSPFTESAVQTPATAPSTTTTARRGKFPSDLKTIACTFPGCHKSFNRPARLAAHMRSHTNDRPFKCDFPGCDKSYTEQKHLSLHVKGTHESERKHVCDEDGCGKGFLTATRLRRHASVHTGADQFRCKDYPPCNLTFRKHQTLQRHVRSAHLGEPAFPCRNEGCREAFDSSGALNRHVEREHGVLRFWCEQCGKGEDGEDGEVGGSRSGFTTLALLQAHMRLNHLSCMFCDLQFRAQWDLDQHMEAQHSGTPVSQRKTVPCSWPDCPKTFTKLANMKVHIATAHEGLRFLCSAVDLSDTAGLENWSAADNGCRSAFTSKAKLAEHIRHFHLREPRPKPTSALSGDHVASDDLIADMAGLADEARRQLSCGFEACDARFIRYHDLNTHLQQQHGHNQARFGRDIAQLTDADIAAALQSTAAEEDFDTAELVNRMMLGLAPMLPGSGDGPDTHHEMTALEDNANLALFDELEARQRLGASVDDDWGDLGKLVNLEQAVIDPSLDGV